MPPLVSLFKFTRAPFFTSGEIFSNLRSNPHWHNFNDSQPLLFFSCSRSVQSDASPEAGIRNSIQINPSSISQAVARGKVSHPSSEISQQK